MEIIYFRVQSFAYQFAFLVRGNSQGGSCVLAKGGGAPRRHGGLHGDFFIGGNSAILGGGEHF